MKATSRGEPDQAIQDNKPRLISNNSSTKSQDTGAKGPGKREFFKSLIRSGSRKSVAKANTPNEAITDPNQEKEKGVECVKKAHSTVGVPKSFAKLYHYDYSAHSKRPLSRGICIHAEDESERATRVQKEAYEARFAPEVPVSVADLHELLKQGRHPEILEQAIMHKITRMPRIYSAHSDECKTLWTMLDVIKEKRMAGELDAVQMKTLEDLGRIYDWVQFQ